MQIVHPFAGSIQHYFDEIADPDRYRPDHCPQCEAKHPLTGHGFYCRTLVDATFDGVVRVRRYLCRSCKGTVSLLPQFVLPWLRFGISVIALVPAADFVSRALRMLESIGWIAAHRFLFSQLRVHLLGWPACLVPAGRRTTLAAARPAS